MLSDGELILTINELCRGSVGCIKAEILNGQRETILVITENAIFTDKHIQDYSALLLGLIPSNTGFIRLRAACCILPRKTKKTTWLKAAANVVPIQNFWTKSNPTYLK